MCTKITGEKQKGINVRAFDFGLERMIFNRQELRPTAHLCLFVILWLALMVLSSDNNSKQDG
jgi:hypothetical protein